MKKLGKWIIFSLIIFIVGIGGVFAKTFDLQTVGDLVLEENPNAESFYIIGNYIFTMTYVNENNLNTEDFMLAGHSIDISGTEVKIKGSDAYKKMSVYQILAHTDSEGSVIDWYIGDNLIGENKINSNTEFEVGYIDYKKINNVYTVKFVDENGKELAKREVIEGRKVAAPMNNTKEGYHFAGWYNEDNLFDVTKENITSDITLQQKWTAKQVTIKFDGEVEGSIKEKNYTYPDIIPSDLAEIRPTAKAEYIFKFWYDSSSDKIEAFDFNKELELNKNDISRTIVLKAKLEDAHKVIFKGQIDGQSSDKFISIGTTQYANAEHKLDVSQIPTTDQEGYDFIGWFTENDQKITPQNYTFLDLENVVIGKWEKKVYTITFDTDGGTQISNRQVKHGEKVENPGDAEKISQDKYNGYEFIGWNLCKDNTCDESFDFNTPITSNLTLKAQYKQVVYTNKMMNDFASQITDENISAFVREDTKLDIAIVNKQASLSKNINRIVTILSEFVKIKNIESIRINSNTVLTKDNATETLKKLFENLGPDFESAKLEDLYNVSFTINFTLKDNFYNETNTQISSYKANFSTNFELVKNEDELRKALTGNKEIIIKDWEGNITKPLTISKNIVIDGRNTEITSNINEHKPVFTITSGSVVIKDLTLIIDVLKPSEYNKDAMNAKTNKNTIGIEVEKNATLTANNFHVKNKETIDAKKMKIGDDDLKASTVTINENAAILLKGTLYASNISYEDEIYGSPTVLATKDATMNVLGGNKQEYIYNIVRNNDGTGEQSKRVSEYIHYYKDYKNSRLIFVNYVSMSRKYTNIAYINNEQYFIPKNYEENGYDYKYENEITEKKYVFKNQWEYSSDLESGTISNDELKQKKATLTSGDYTYYAQYDEILAPVIKKFYVDSEGTKSTISNKATIHLEWESDNVTKYCITTSEDKKNCNWEDIKDQKAVTKALDFNSFGEYTYHAYLKNNEDVISKEAITTISYIKKDYTGNAMGLLDYQPKGLGKENIDGMYRYSGKDVENYICFGTDDVNKCLDNPNQYLYQIIGITAGGKFKLIKSTPYTWAIWNDKYMFTSCGPRGDRCKYQNSKMYDILNGQFNKILSDWEQKVDYATWFTGAATADDKTGHAVYQSETKDRTTNGKYGLMYASDYYYAYGDGKGNRNCQKDSCDSYLTTPYFEWTITRENYDSTVYSGYVFYIYPENQRLRHMVMDVEYAIRPVFYLKLDTSITSGSGSKTRPFIIKK